MLCCAFAVFLLGQIIWPLDRLYIFLTGRPSAFSAPTPDRAVSWRLDSPALVAAPPLKRSFLRTSLIGILLAEGLIAASLIISADIGPFEKLSAPKTVQASFFETFDALHAPLCRSLGLRADTN